MSGNHKTSVSLEAIPESAKEIRRHVQESADNVGFDGEALFDLLIGIGEAFNNAVKHGCADSGEGICARICANSEEMVVVLDYGGDCFVHEIPPASELHKLDNGGLGRFLMYSLLDDISYTFRDGRTSIRLAKRKSGRREEGQ